MFDSTQSTSFGYLPCHFAIQAAKSCRASCVSLRSERPAELLWGSRRRPCGAGSPRRYAGSARESAAPGSLGQHLADSFLEACMVVGDGQFHGGRRRGRRIGGQRRVMMQGVRWCRAAAQCVGAGCAVMVEACWCQGTAPRVGGACHHARTTGCTHDASVPGAARWRHAQDKPVRCRG